METARRTRPPLRRVGLTGFGGTLANLRQGNPERIYQAQRAGVFARLTQGERLNAVAAETGSCDGRNTPWLAVCRGPLLGSGTEHGTGSASNGRQRRTGAPSPMTARRTAAELAFA